MKILALDCTATVCSVALCEDETPIALYTLNNGNTHSESLLPMIETVLRHAHLSVSDVDLFACTEGPGSFTGVRIGCATIKGLAFDRQKPCIGISTLEALAENLQGLDGLLCPVMNARRGQVYNALFRFENGAIQRLCPDRAIALTELDKELAGETTVRLCGDGYELAVSALTQASLTPTPSFLIPQNAGSVARCALRAYQTGKSGTDSSLKPTYLRLPQAERERKERLAAQKATQE
ncbi:MAG: tRNA (adenosine(37)-N6)-threonylcarbamoyltransferase complex dimerization subunit type 1 TsaB [Clostridia bacterium]|nr:tRNA (adenosine(37)-N6)-threonylcarbamoyltransferase complex dimerization subunit type 1 TsaB [Clostridia bacterium]